jgi:hypothetical protein
MQALADLGEDHLHRGHPASILVAALVWAVCVLPSSLNTEVQRVSASWKIQVSPLKISSLTLELPWLSKKWDRYGRVNHENLPGAHS